MSNEFLKSKVKTLQTSPELPEYTKVVIITDDDGQAIEVGNDTGATLEITCPWGTEAMAQNILQGLVGWKYKPYSADGAILDPAVELGDTLSVDDVPSAVYAQNLAFSRNATSGISAPNDAELEHEFPYKPAAEKRYTRQLKVVRAELRVQANEISAKVSQEGGDPRSFGWSLLVDQWTVSSNNRVVFKVDDEGAEVTGTITATAGNIGGCEIRDGLLHIANASIDNLDASKINAGVLSVDRIEDLSLDANKLHDNAVVERTIAGGNVSGSKLSTGVNTSLGYANTAQNYLVGGTKNPNKMYIQQLDVCKLRILNMAETDSDSGILQFQYNGTEYKMKSLDVNTPDGVQRIVYLGV